MVRLQMHPPITQVLPTVPSVPSQHKTARIYALERKTYPPEMGKKTHIFLTKHDPVDEAKQCLAQFLEIRKLAFKGHLVEST